MRVGRLGQVSSERVSLKIRSVPKNSLTCCRCSLRDPVEGMHHEDFYRLLAKYKFTIAIENAVCTDYITEKFWRPFILGTVPILFGSPAIKVCGQCLSVSAIAAPPQAKNTHRSETRGRQTNGRRL